MDCFLLAHASAKKDPYGFYGYGHTIRSRQTSYTVKLLYQIAYQILGERYKCSMSSADVFMCA